MRKSKHTIEFKDSAVQLALNSDVLTKDIAQDLDINPKTLYNWISAHKRANNIQTDGRRNSQKPQSKESLNEENQRLRKENKLLKQERDILYPKGRLRAKRQPRISPRKLYEIRMDKRATKEFQCKFDVSSVESQS